MVTKFVTTFNKNINLGYEICNYGKEVKNIFEKDTFIMFSKDFIKRKDIPDKLLLILAYLRIYSAKNGIISTSINFICNKIGYKPNRNKGKINDQVITVLEWMHNQSYIILKRDIKQLDPKECFVIEINIKNNIYEQESDYVILTENEFDKIAEYTTKKNKEDLLKVYLNIKKFMNFDKTSTPLCYPSHLTLCRDCNITSSGTMSNLIHELLAIGILYTYNTGKYLDNNKHIKQSNNIYALSEADLEGQYCEELIRSYYSLQGLTIEKFIK